MTPTRVRTLLVIAAAFALLGWLLVAAIDQLAGRLLQVPLSAAGALALMALALLIWGLLARPRLERRPGREPLNPIVAARTAALAMAASRTGAGVGGFYLGVAIGMVPSLSAPAGREYAVAAVAAAVASVGLAAVGLWVESICRLRGDDDSGGPAGPRASGQAGSEAARSAS